MRALATIVLVGLGLLFGIILVVVLSEDTDLEVQQTGLHLLVINRGTAPVWIKEISVNDRQDCRVRAGIIFQTEEFRPIELKVGDRQVWFSNCNIVRVTITTSKGARTYSF